MKVQREETEAEELARYQRVLAADIDWWRNTAVCSKYDALRALAFAHVDLLTKVLDAWTRR